LAGAGATLPLIETVIEPLSESEHWLDDAMPEERFQAEQLSTAGPQAAPSSIEQADEEMRVVCPRCCRATEHLKIVDVPNVIFLVAYIAWNNETVVGCPECVRRLLGRRLLTSLPLSNILYPVPASFYVAQYFVSYAKGHSSQATAAAHRMTKTEMLAQQEAAIKLNRPARREWIILTLLVLVIAGIWIAGLLWTPSTTSPIIEGRTVQEWTDQLRGGQPNEKLDAIAVLSRGGEAARTAIPALRQTVLHDQDAIVRQQAYHTLNAIDPESTRGLPFPGFFRLPDD
jgi:hypothetical protein